MKMGSAASNPVAAADPGAAPGGAPIRMATPVPLSIATSAGGRHYGKDGLQGRAKGRFANPLHGSLRPCPLGAGGSAFGPPWPLHDPTGVRS